MRLWPRRRAEGGQVLPMPTSGELVVLSPGGRVGVRCPRCDGTIHGHRETHLDGHLWFAICPVDPPGTVIVSLGPEAIPPLLLPWSTSRARAVLARALTTEHDTEVLMSAASVRSGTVTR